MSCWKADTGCAIEEHDPFSFIRSTGHTPLDWLNLKLFNQFSHGVFEDFGWWDGMRNKSAAFLLSPFSFPCTSPGPVLHLRGGLAWQDGGCIMSWGGFTVRFTTSSLSLRLSPLNVPPLWKAAKSLLTGKLWTHRELIRVSARLAICMWIGCGCIPGLFMSFTPQCLRLLASKTSCCHRCMSVRNNCLPLYTTRKSDIDTIQIYIPIVLCFMEWFSKHLVEASFYQHWQSVEIQHQCGSWFNIHCCHLHHLKKSGPEHLSSERCSVQNSL